jgi:hypothetical protein
MEKQVTALLREQGEETQVAGDLAQDRNSVLWTASIVLVFPVFAIAYFLSKDLRCHEKHQQTFLKRLFPEKHLTLHDISVRRYLIITAATLGIGIIYWLYKIVNMYNNHFKEHRMIDYDVSRFMEAKSHGESM